MPPSGRTSVSTKSRKSELSSRRTIYTTGPRLRQRRLTVPHTSLQVARTTSPMDKLRQQTLTQLNFAVPFVAPEVHAEPDFLNNEEWEELHPRKRRKIEQPEAIQTTLTQLAFINDPTSSVGAEAEDYGIMPENSLLPEEPGNDTQAVDCDSGNKSDTTTAQVDESDQCIQFAEGVCRARPNSGGSVAKVLPLLKEGASPKEPSPRTPKFSRLLEVPSSQSPPETPLTSRSGKWNLRGIIRHSPLIYDVHVPLPRDQSQEGSRQGSRDASISSSQFSHKYEPQRLCRQSACPEEESRCGHHGGYEQRVQVRKLRGKIPSRYSIDRASPSASSSQIYPTEFDPSSPLLLTLDEDVEDGSSYHDTQEGGLLTKSPTSSKKRDEPPMHSTQPSRDGRCHSFIDDLNFGSPSKGLSRGRWRRSKVEVESRTDKAPSNTSTMNAVHSSPKTPERSSRQWPKLQLARSTGWESVPLAGPEQSPGSESSRRSEDRILTATQLLPDSLMNFSLPAHLSSPRFQEN